MLNLTGKLWVSIACKYGNLGIQFRSSYRRAWAFTRTTLGRCWGNRGSTWLSIITRPVPSQSSPTDSLPIPIPTLSRSSFKTSTSQASKSSKTVSGSLSAPSPMPLSSTLATSCRCVHNLSPSTFRELLSQHELFIVLTSKFINGGGVAFGCHRHWAMGFTRASGTVRLWMWTSPGCPLPLSSAHAMTPSLALHRPSPDMGLPPFTEASPTQSTTVSFGAETWMNDTAWNYLKTTPLLNDFLSLVFYKF